MLLAAVATGCDAEATGVDAAVRMDAGRSEDDAGAGTSDAGSGETCRGDEDCDDGVFCNGAEVCDRAAAGADERGCAAAARGPCMTEQECSEDERRCLTVCDLEPDADGDGHVAVACGGDDCDDADPNRFPGNPEVCDAADHDEDCDLGTFGDRDADADGFVDALCCNVDEAGAATCGSDCDDVSPQAAPGLVEACDTVDNDCDGAVDEGVLQTYHPDRDGDSFGDPDGTPTMACTPPAGFVANDTDCDDAQRLVNPATSELCDGLDNNCDGRVDEAGVRSFYGDSDGDGYGDPSDVVMVTSCEPPSGYVASANDCDPGNGAVHPGAAEVCNGLDDDCNLGLAGGGRDASEDRDGDLHAPVDAACVGGPYPADDCNDARPDIYLGAPERCDRVDNDCSDASSPGGSDPSEDRDGDMHAPAGAACSGGYPKDDCDDDDAAVHPGRPERCDRIDSDCSGGGGVELGEDADDDGFAPPGASCSGGFDRTDCDDADATTHPGAAELCDRVDNDCSLATGPGGVDPAEDVDGDGHAPVGASCAGGFPADDCDDDDATTHPGAAELCDRVDNDCSLVSDPGGVDPDEDVDGDGHAPIGHACRGGSLPRDDCDDGEASTYPGAPELCDRVDSDCGGDAFAEDADDDGHAPLDATCLDGAGTRPRDDCDDDDALSYPGAVELCDRIDNDCDAGGGPDPSEDADDDGHAPLGAACTGGPLPADDCDDDDDTTFPGAAERCDRVDNDCSAGGGADPLEDADGDGHAPIGAGCSGGPLPADDCDDAPSTGGATHPGAPELCDRIDNDCSSGGGVEVSEDADADGHAPIGGSCEGGPLPEDDCDDRAGVGAGIHPGATEVCNGVNEDCDASTDEGTTVTCWADLDDDEYAAAGASTSQACGCGTSLTATEPLDPTTTDCNDSSSSVRPGAMEICNGVNDDCDASTDEGTTVTCWADGDDDGFAPAGASTTQACTCGTNLTGTEPLGPTTTDCNDSSSSVRPTATESCNGVDDDCDASTDEGTTVTCWADGDDDGYAPTGAAESQECACGTNLSGVDPTGGAGSTDCNDLDAGIHPGAGEDFCDGVDEDCDGATDEGRTVSCWADGDDDEFAPLGAAQTQACVCGPSLTATEPTGRSTDTDCDDGDDATFPGAAELCDRLDNNCSSGGGVDASEDADGDGHAPTGGQCEGGPLPEDDCNDVPAAGGATTYPGAPELCDGIDNGCDLFGDPGGPDLAEDGDGDGHAPPGASCAGGYPRDDCDDDDPMSYPSASELCDRVDNDCSSGGGADPSEDVDDDGHAPVGAACSMGPLPRDDCDDGDPTSHPGAIEHCNRVDNDCSSGGGVDPSEDVDGDGHAPLDATCSAGGPGFPADDCDDTRADVNPDRTEIPGDGEDLDENCSPMRAIACYVDGDTDGFHDGTQTTADTVTTGCAGAANLAYASESGDCCDLDGRARPGAPWVFSATEIACPAGGFDFDCDGSTAFRWTDTAWSCPQVAGCGSVDRGWFDGSVPACGATAEWVQSCSATGCSPVCFCTATSADRVDRTQGCR